MVRVFARHFFSSHSAVEGFPAIIRTLERLAAGTGWTVEMMATFLPAFPPPPVDARTVKLTLDVSGQHEGAGTKLWEGFCRAGGMALLVDGDMQTFAPDEIRVLQHLITRMREEGKTFGCASRTLVRMHRDAALNNLRIAQEAFYLSFSLPELPDNPFGVSLARLPATYRALGDVFSGCIAIDLDHPIAQQVKAEVERMQMRGLFRGFALEYYLGMRFAQLRQAVSTYLPTKPDHAVTDRSGEAVKAMIQRDYQELLQSPIGDALAKHIANETMQRAVEQLVGAAALREVLELLQ